MISAIPPLIIFYFHSLTSLKKVSWVKRKGEQLHLITFGASTYSSDSRFLLEFQPPNDWQLHIKYANERDEGQFECQINSSPPLVFVVFLEVIGGYIFSFYFICQTLNQHSEGGVG